jgi:hypothetical protein
MPDLPPATVIVSYEIDPRTSQPVVTVTPFVVKVSPGQVIRFQRAGAMRGKMRVTFKDKDFFDSGNPEFWKSGAFHEGDGDLLVKSIPERTTFLCELLDQDGNRIAESREGAGGAVEPERT